MTERSDVGGALGAVVDGEIDILGGEALVAGGIAIIDLGVGGIEAEVVVEEVEGGLFDFGAVKGGGGVAGAALVKDDEVTILEIGGEEDVEGELG